MSMKNTLVGYKLCQLTLCLNPCQQNENLPQEKYCFKKQKGESLSLSKKRYL